MVYYLVDIRRKCAWGPCDKTATHALHTSGTMVFNHYCHKHGKMEVRVRNKRMEEKKT